MKWYGIGILLGIFLSWAQEPEIVQQQREKMSKYQEALEVIREKKFLQDVLVRYKNEAEVKIFLESLLHQEISDSANLGLSQTFLALNLVAPPFDYRDHFAKMFGSQAAAFYDPEQKTFFFVTLEMPEEQLAPIIVHELHHGLQDQHYNLGQMMKQSSQNHSEDLQNVIRFLVEGEATFIMNWYALKEFYPQQFSHPFLMSNLRFQKNVDRSTLEAQYLASPSEWMQNAGKILQSTPEYFYQALYAPYSSGAVILGEMYKKGGWELIHQVFQNPPTTMEQTLHWEEKYLSNRDFPTKLFFPLPHLLWTLSGQGRQDVSSFLKKITQQEFVSQWQISARQNNLKQSSWTTYLGECQLLFRTSFGEFGLRSILQQFSKKGAEAQRAAQGWDGDTFLLFKTNEEDAFLWTLTFDEEKDATEAESAFLPLLKHWKKNRPQLQYQLTRKEKDIFITATSPQEAELLHQTIWNLLKKQEDARPFFEKKEMCAYCHSLQVVPIIYGMPRLEDSKLAEKGKIFLGGCILPEPKTNWHCLECFQQWP